MIMLSELVEFVLQYRGNTVFIDMTPETIYKELLEAFRESRLAWYEEPEKGITGIMVLDINQEDKILFVRRNLNITPKAIITMCCAFEAKFKGYRLQGIKHKFKEYKNPLKLVTRWASMSARKLQTI